MYKTQLKLHKLVNYSYLMQSDLKVPFDGVRQEYLRSMIHTVKFSTGQNYTLYGLRQEYTLQDDGKKLIIVSGKKR